MELLPNYLSLCQYWRCMLLCWFRVVTSSFSSAAALVAIAPVGCTVHKAALSWAHGFQALLLLACESAHHNRVRAYHHNPYLHLR